MPTENAIQYPNITLDHTLPFFHPRAPQTHKGSYGTLLLICGNYGMIGAAAMAAKAALRSGVGLVNVVTQTRCYPLLAPLLPEAVFTVLDEEALSFHTHTEDGTNQRTHGAVCANFSGANRAKLLHALHRADACVIGCGLGADAAYFVPVVLREARCPLVVDADALNYLAQHPTVWGTATAPLLLTPHPAEMARLCGTSTCAIQADRVNAAISFATSHQVHTILKGTDTIVATPSGSAKINPTGNAGMAKGGSGDVLAGMLGAFLAQQIAPTAAAEAAVYIHGAIGDACARELSQTAMQPTDMIARLPQFFVQVGVIL